MHSVALDIARPACVKIPRKLGCLVDKKYNGVGVLNRLLHLSTRPFPGFSRHMSTEIFQNFAVLELCTRSKYLHMRIEPRGMFSILLGIGQRKVTV